MPALPIPSRVAALAAIMSLCAAAASAAPAPVVSDLRQGGYVVVMRHAHAPGERPGPGAAASGNTLGERQLDAEGRRTAEAMGAAIRATGVPVGEVFVSPAFRAMETARYAGLVGAVATPELGDGGSSMAAQASGPAGDAWLRAKVAQPPRAGTNTFIVTHGPNISRAFNAELADGEAIVFRPGAGGPVKAGQVKIDAWGPAD